MQLERELAVAFDAADAARTIILRHYGADVDVEWKADRSEVTEADRAAEQAIRDVIGRAFPDHAIRGEEFGGEVDAEWSWLIDPIDGTISFVHRVPTFSTLIALCHHGQPALAVADFPALDRRLHAAAGAGAWEGARRLAVSSGFEEHRDLVSRGDRYQFALAGRLDLYQKLDDQLRLFRPYCDAYGHCQVAWGWAALMVDPDLNPWDLAAPALIVREAGGQVLEMPDPNGKVTAISGNPQAVAWLQERLLPRR